LLGKQGERKEAKPKARNILAACWGGRSRAKDPNISWQSIPLSFRHTVHLSFTAQANPVFLNTGSAFGVEVLDILVPGYGWAWRREWRSSRDAASSPWISKGSANALC
jgi:hypothetical protein